MKTAGDALGGCPHSRVQECLSRCPFQGGIPSPYRVVDTQGSGQSDIQKVSDSTSPCIGKEPQASSVLFGSVVSFNEQNLLKNSFMGMYYQWPDAMCLTVWPLSADHLLVESFQQWLLRRLQGPNEKQLIGFMIHMLDSTDDGVWREVWIPLRSL